MWSPEACVTTQQQSPAAPPGAETEPSTDDEVESFPISPAEWKAYEKDVAAYVQRIDPHATVTHNVIRRGLISGVDRQIDSLVVGIVAGDKFEIAIECKHYSKKIGIGRIDEFAGKLADIGVDRGVMYALSGATSGAKARATGAVQPKIGFGQLPAPTPTPLATPGWEHVLAGLPHFGDCGNENCIAGDVTWSEWEQEDATSVIAGSCDSCGTWAVRCTDCGEETGFFWDEQKCDGCDAVYELVKDHDNVLVDVVRLATSND
jgi:hypothetical protein